MSKDAEAGVSTASAGLMSMKWGRVTVGEKLEIELGSGRVQCHDEDFGM